MIQAIRDIAAAVRQAGGRALLVGGPVRDALLHRTVKDFDLEIFDLSAEDIERIAQRFGPVKSVGQIFGILKVRVGQHDIDLAAPRRERKVSPGHRGFSVAIDPHLPLREAARRRDFTINAIYQDPLTEEILDPFHGQDDLRNTVLRIVDARTFVEDPLRVLRAFQFAARFELTIDPETKQLLHTMLPSVAELPKDRLREEWIKLCLLAKHPSRGFQLALDIGYFHAWPEFELMAKTMQGATEHPEGDVWRHTMMAVDKAVMIAERDSLTDATRLITVLGTFCHDVGKPATLRREGDRITAHGHAQAGVVPARRWLSSQGFPEDVIEPALNLVRDHMVLHELYESDRRAPVTDGAIRRMLRKLHPASIQQLVTVGEADFLGRGPWVGKYGQEVWPRHYPRKTWFLDRLARAKLEDDPPPIIQGRDLIALGWQPGPAFSPVIEAAEKYGEDTNATKEAILAILTSSSSPEEALRKLALRSPA